MIAVSPVERYGLRRRDLARTPLPVSYRCPRCGAAEVWHDGRHHRPDGHRVQCCACLQYYVIGGGA